MPQVIAVRPKSPPSNISSSRMTLREMHSSGFAFSAFESCSRRSGMLFMQNSDAFSPLEPCPSKTHKSAWLYEPLNGQQTTPLSWLIFAAEKPRGPGIKPCRVCVPIRERSNGWLERRELMVLRDISFAWYLIEMRGERSKPEARASSLPEFLLRHIGVCDFGETVISSSCRFRFEEFSSLDASSLLPSVTLTVSDSAAVVLEAKQPMPSQQTLRARQLTRGVTPRGSTAGGVGEIPGVNQQTVGR